jgi:hypothetical protein
MKYTYSAQRPSNKKKNIQYGLGFIALWCAHFVSVEGDCLCNHSLLFNFMVIYTDPHLLQYS